MGKVEVVLSVLGIGVSEARRGRLWARCPYHSPDNNPSWCIRVTKERYGQHICFSCKEGGTLPALVAHAKGIDLDAAAAWLRGISDDEPEAEPEPLPAMVRLEHAPLSQRSFKLPLEFIHDPLPEWVTPARRYVEKRGITAEQVAKWGIGYAVDGRLAGRIVVPTFQYGTGLPAGYMARTFAKSTRRYLYPDASAHSDLDVMFGEVYWPAPGYRKGDLNGEPQRVVVTEGAFNALAVERAVGGVVAALGGSFVRPMHTGKLAGFGEVVLLTDSDDAGDRAAAELTAALVRHVSKIRRACLPRGVDANDATAEELRCLLVGG